MQHDYEKMNDDQRAAYREFREAETDLLAALNGHRRPVATDAEAVPLRQAMMRARAKCEAIGIEVETLIEFAQRQRREAEVRIRSEAAKVERMPVRLPRRERQWMGGFAAAFFAAWAVTMWPTLGGVIGALVGALVIFAAVEGLLAELVPTPALLLGREAARSHVYLEDVFPAGSANAHDFLEGHRREWMAMTRRGETATVRAN